VDLPSQSVFSLRFKSLSPPMFDGGAPARAVSALML
jgi:hypothetical protein